MRTPCLMAAIACVVMPAIALAATNSSDNSEVTSGPLPDWVSLPELLPVPADQRGVIFVRRWDVETHLDDEGQTTFQSYHMRLLQPNALQLGNISIAWNPAAGSPVVHWLRVHRDGAERDVMGETAFNILQREDGLEESMLNGVLTAVLQVPDLRVGDELDIAFSIREVEPTLGSASAGILLLAPSPAPGRFRLRLSWDEGQEPGIKISPDIADQVARSGGAMKMDFDMPGPANPPKDAPPRYNWQRIVEYSDFETWQSISQRFAPLFADAARLAPDSPLKQEAARIVAAHKTPMDRAAAALELVQQQVRYIYVGFNNSNLTPASAEETWQRRYGDCKGKTALLLALLSELGIEAEPVLVNNSGGDDGFDARLPNPGLFDHVLVRATIGGETYWLDGTLPHVVPPTPEPSLPYRWTLPIAERGQTLEQIPWKPMKRPSALIVFDIDARAGFDQPANVAMTTITRGAPALMEYLRFSSVTDDQLENSIRQSYEGGGTWDTVESVSWRFDEPTQASVLEISGKGPLDWDDEGENGRDMTLPGGGFSPPERRMRSSGQDQDAPYFSVPEFDCRVTTVRVPSDTDISDWSYNSTFQKYLFGRVYRRSFERHEQDITMVRQTRVLDPEISADEARGDNAKLAEFDNSMARVIYQPGDDVNLNDKNYLPAAYANDWVSNDAACMEPLTVVSIEAIRDAK